MKIPPIALIAGLGAVGVLAMLSSSKASASSATDPGGGGGGGGGTPPVTDPCAAALKRVQDAARAAVAAQAALQKNPADTQAQALLKTAQQAGQAAVAMWPKSCGTLPAFDAQGNPVTVASGKAPPTSKAPPAGAGAGLPVNTSPPANAACDLKRFQVLAQEADQAAALANQTPDRAHIQAANDATASLKAFALAWAPAGCPETRNVASVAAQIAQWQPAPLPDRFGEMIQTIPPRSDVPILDDLLADVSGNQFNTTSAYQNEYKGPVCGPDIMFGGTEAVWPIASTGLVPKALGSCDCDPVCAHVPLQTMLNTLDAWAKDLAALTRPSTASASDVAETVRDMGIAEKTLREHGPGIFLRYLAFLHSVMKGALSEVTDEDEQAMANHVVLVTGALLQSMGATQIHDVPFIWVPRDEAGEFSIPRPSALNLWPGTLNPNQGEADAKASMTQAQKDAANAAYAASYHAAAYGAGAGIAPSSPNRSNGEAEAKAAMTQAQKDAANAAYAAAYHAAAYGAGRR